MEKVPEKWASGRPHHRFLNVAEPVQTASHFATPPWAISQTVQAPTSYIIEKDDREETGEGVGQGWGTLPMLDVGECGDTLATVQFTPRARATSFAASVNNDSFLIVPL